MQRFKSAFCYALIEDRAIAVDVIKGDLKSTKLIGLLICGDMGCGKPEVAMRAAFKTGWEAVSRGFGSHYRMVPQAL